MDAHGKLEKDVISWLLNSDTPGIRYLALRDLLNRPSDDLELSTARQEAHQTGPISRVLANMNEAGYWVQEGPGYNPKYRSTVWSIILLAQLGALIQEDERIKLACSYLIDHALAEGGQFSYSGNASGTFDCLQGNLCWSLLELGFDDPRLDTAFDWMARTVIGEGIAPAEERGVEGRYNSMKCGPNFACGANNKLPCAWGAVRVMLAFSRLPEGRRTPAIQIAMEQGVKFLFSVDPVSAGYPSGSRNKPSLNWWKFGFPSFYVTDVLKVAEVLVKLGYGNDPRLKNTLDLIRQKQDGEGRWKLEYDYAGKTWVSFGVKGEPNPWVTLRALQVLKVVE